MNDALRVRLQQEGSLDLVLRVRPGARTSRLKEQRGDGVWKVDIAAVAEDGAANENLRRFLAAEFGIPVSQVEIVSGQTHREKRVRLSRGPL